MSCMWATPVIRVNYSGISGEGQESARNLPFPGVIWRTAMPQLRSFVTPALSSRDPALIRNDVADTTTEFYAGHVC